ncbi:MAG: hypothetical protein KatS3mg057_1987 [Herpetosiphonaceae bacterium]|nr:MAG: hypothetical protein KatS3mg057_1987 [Herpetosiphonaceae bacterium]
MIRRLRIRELLPDELIEANREHIIDFLLQEGIAPDPEDLGETEVPERELKQLLSEMADDMGR